MKGKTALALLLFSATIYLACSHGGLIAWGDGYSLSVEDLGFEVRKLGPSAGYDGTPGARRQVVETLIARSLLADAAEDEGYGVEGLEDAVGAAERLAVADAYRKWRIDKRILLPRVKTKPWYDKLDRRLKLEQVVFAVYPVAEEFLQMLESGGDFREMLSALGEREDIRHNDLGWMYWKQINRDVANVIFRAGKGETSEILDGPDGYHIYYVVDDEPIGLNIETIAIRARRFVRAMEEQKLLDEEKRALAGQHGVKFDEAGFAAALEAFHLSFQGTRPSDDKMGAAVAAYDQGEVTVGDLFSLYYGIPAASRPYVGDFHGVRAFAMDAILPELEVLAGYRAGLERTREVRWAVKKAREEHLVPLMEQRFRDQVEFTEADVRVYFEEHREEFRTSGSYRVARIVVESQPEARMVLAELTAGAEFGDLARAMSTDEYTAAQGGELGEIAFGIQPAYDSVVMDLAPGEVSRPFTTADGVELIKLISRTDPRLLSFDESKEKVEEFISNSQANEILARWVEARKAERGIVIDEQLLGRIHLEEPEYRKGGPSGQQG
jgi:parvulin-like peptidyl-prolyl isomerase